MSLIQTWKFFICLFLDMLGQEIMSDDHLVKKQALLDDKKINNFAILKFFLKG